MAVEFLIKEAHRQAGVKYGYPADCPEDRLRPVFYPANLRETFNSVLPDGFKVERQIGINWWERLGFQWFNPKGQYVGSAGCSTFHSPFACCGVGSISSFVAGGEYSLELFEALFKSQLSDIPVALILPKYLLGDKWGYLLPSLYNVIAKHSILVSEFRNKLYTNHLLELRFAFKQEIAGVEEFFFDTRAIQRVFGEPRP